MGGGGAPGGAWNPPGDLPAEGGGPPGARSGGGGWSLGGRGPRGRETAGGRRAGFLGGGGRGKAQGAVKKWKFWGSGGGEYRSTAFKTFLADDSKEKRGGPPGAPFFPINYRERRPNLKKGGGGTGKRETGPPRAGELLAGPGGRGGEREGFGGLPQRKKNF